MVSVHLVPAFQDNYIYCIQYRQDAVFIVDPGDAEPVMAFLQRRRLSPTAILATHHHGDHVGGNPVLARAYNIPIFGPSRRIPGVTHIVEAGRHRIDGVDIDVMAVPGHTRDHIAYYFEHSLFCGDTLFAAGCGRLFEGTPPQMHDSLCKLAALPDHTGIYCGHEYTLNNLRFARQVEPDNPVLRERLRTVEVERRQGRPTLPSRMDLEQATNPFLRVHLPSVQAAARRFDPACAGDPVSTLAAIRRWKDAF